MHLTYSIEEITLTYLTALMSQIESAGGSSIKEVELPGTDGMTAYVPSDSGSQDVGAMEGYDVELKGLAALITKEPDGLRQIFESGQTKMMVPIERQDALISDSIDSITIMDGEETLITIKSYDWIL